MDEKEQGKLIDVVRYKIDRAIEDLESAELELKAISCVHLIIEHIMHHFMQLMQCFH